MTVQQKIKKNISRFELSALLRVLHSKGYKPDEIFYRSHASLASQGNLIETIRFETEPKKATIYLNFGLLCAQTPLPSYFQKLLDSGHVDGYAFQEFIGFFDHQLITSFLQASYPERGKAVFSDFETMKQSILTMIDLRCVATQQWLFSLVYPELDVTVKKAVVKRGLTNEQIKLGLTALGSDAIFGRESKVPVNGISVTLYSESEELKAGCPWPKEVKSRLYNLIFPLLSFVGADLEILLIIRTQRSFAKLQAASFLGYDKIRGGDDTFRRLRIFSGHIDSKISFDVSSSQKKNQLDN